MPNSTVVTLSRWHNGSMGRRFLVEPLFADVRSTGEEQDADVYELGMFVQPRENVFEEVIDARQ